MQPTPPIRSSMVRMCGLVVVSAVMVGCAVAPKPSTVPPAPSFFLWPDPTFLAERQCQGQYSADVVQSYLATAARTMELPSTRAVVMDSVQRCITVTVDDIHGAHIAEVFLRGLAVPRQTVVLKLEAPPPPWQGS